MRRAEDIIGNVTAEQARQIASVREVCARNKDIVIMLGQDDSPHSVTATIRGGEPTTRVARKPRPDVWYIGACRQTGVRRRTVTYEYQDGEEWRVGATTVYPEEDGVWRNTYTRHSGGVITVWQEAE